MTAHSVLNVRAAPEWGNSELYRYYERNGLGYGTVHMSNSGIPSAKADPISRMFPPLFMIKISEEEKIAEDLHEIKSMQLIVQIIMITVS